MRSALASIALSRLGIVKLRKVRSTDPKVLSFG
jgi:hypothetical protein